MTFGAPEEDELRSGALVQLLPDWECLGGLPIVAIYRRTKPRLYPINAFVSNLAHAFRRYNDVVPVRSWRAHQQGTRVKRLWSLFSQIQAHVDPIETLLRHAVGLDEPEIRVH